MDAASLSTTLATLVGLICNYRQEKGGREQLSHQKFMEWLEYHRHEEVKTLISTTFHLQQEVDSLLREDGARLAAKLNGVESMLAQLLSRIEGFQPIVGKIHPQTELSVQAVGILTAFVESGAGFLSIFQGSDGPRFNFVPISNSGDVPTYAPGEPRFFDDDIRALRDLGLLNEDFNSSGKPFYRLSRAGNDYAMQTKPQSRDESQLGSRPSAEV